MHCCLQWCSSNALQFLEQQPHGLGSNMQWCVQTFQNAICIGLTWQEIFSRRRGAAGLASERRLLMLAAHWTQKFPENSKNYSLLSKAGASAITYLRMGTQSCATASGRLEWEYGRVRVLQTPRSVQKEEKRCSRHQSREFPATHGEAAN